MWACIPGQITYQAKWKIGIEQIERVMSQGLRFDYVTFDEEYGKVPEFIFESDRLGQNSIYFISNAPAKESLKTLLEIDFSRWHVEKWFEQAKQGCGSGAFEVRTYTSLIRHWLASPLAIYFLADHTTQEKEPTRNKRKFEMDNSAVILNNQNRPVQG